MVRERRRKLERNMGKLTIRAYYIAKKRRFGTSKAKSERYSRKNTVNEYIETAIILYKKKKDEEKGMIMSDRGILVEKI